ncbi:MAG: adenosylcobinamide-GDP ribazoletransferase [Rhodobacteraceae bacterium]|nr:adenosylcobinamide-GDP ribazoletransferase [Paracoccaceae bacterium]
MRNFAPFQQLATALALLTRLPLPRLPDAAFADQSRAVWAFPLVGLLVGGIALGVGLLALTLGLPATGAAGLVLLTQVMVTGAMHEDGLADTADGFWGGFSRDRRLEIMRDSHIGTYGVLALILSLGLRWQALTALLDGPALLVAAIVSRAVMPVLMTALPHARTDGLSRGVGRPGPRAVLLGLVLAGGLSLLLVGLGALLALVLGALAAVTLGLMAKRRIGGQTGDILGATQQCTEIVILLGFVALWS